MNWSDIRVFLAIARAGSLGGAAKALGISHPTAGRRLKVLEKHSGGALFRRVGERLITTQLGDSVLALAEEMEASALAIDRTLAGKPQHVEGILRISSADWFAAYVLTPVLAELSQRYPLIVPEILPGQRQFDLARREADLAFRIVPFTEPDIVQRKVMSMAYGLYRSARHCPPLDLNQSGQPVILMNTAQLHYPDVAWLQATVPHARAVAHSSSRSVQAQLCAQGLGLAVLPRPLGDSLASLTRVETAALPPARDIWMGYHQDLRRSDKLRALADLAGEMLAGQEEGGRAVLL